jgi:SAM-dependent methyltransferase
VHEYSKKSGIDLSTYFAGIEHVSLYSCSKTGYRYWKPFTIAGSESFYREMASSTPLYYRSERWEYSIARKLLQKEDEVLDIGCGRGFFLKSIEGTVKSGFGLEFSQYAIENKVTAYPIRAAMIQDIAKENTKFDVICSFQVLEHVVNPKEFIQGCLQVLKPGGKLVLSTPNFSSITAQNKLDCWDLPPHHVGHYTEDTYQKIGEIFGLKLLAIQQETRGAVEISLTLETQKKLVYRIFRKLFAVSSRLLFRVTKEPGHSIVAIYEYHA